VARGFESKDVEFQQSEADRGKAKPTRGLTPEERDVQVKRRTIELSLTRAKADLAVARSAAHRGMLDQAIASLEEQLRQLA
jgi:hypothetical protein